jgi:hypothetical protein
MNIITGTINRAPTFSRNKLRLKGFTIHENNIHKMSVIHVTKQYEAIYCLCGRGPIHHALSHAKC